MDDGNDPRLIWNGSTLFPDPDHANLQAAAASAAAREHRCIAAASSWSYLFLPAAQARQRRQISSSAGTLHPRLCTEHLLTALLSNRAPISPFHSIAGHSVPGHELPLLTVVPLAGCPAPLWARKNEQELASRLKLVNSKEPCNPTAHTTTFK